MGYLGTKPANQITDSTLIADGTITTADLANNAVTPAKLSTGAPSWDTSGNLGIGTSSPDIFGRFYTRSVGISSSGTTALQINGTSYGAIDLGANGTRTSSYTASAADVQIGSVTSIPLILYTAGAERMRITSGGYQLMGTTSTSRLAAGAIQGLRLTGSSGDFLIEACSTQTPMELGLKDTNGNIVNFYRDTNSVGNITVTTTTTSYNSGSDYRLKENIKPMLGALDKVSLLKPVTWSWKADGSDGQGFIAHELQEVCPDAVSGEKDAVDAEGNPIYQGVDTSFLVATLTAAIQELKAIVDIQQAEIGSLKAQLSNKE